MRGLKIAVAALGIVVAVLLFTIYRLSHRVEAPPAQSPVAQVSLAPSEPAATPAVTPERAPAPEKPSPVVGKQRRRPQAEEASETPPPVTPAAAPQKTPEPPVAAAPAPSTPPPAEVAPAPRSVPHPPAPRHVTLPAGALIMVRTQNTLSTERNFKGDTFSTTLDEPLTADGYVVAEKGAEVEGRIVRSERAGRVEGVSDLAVELVRLHTSDGQKLSIATNLHEVQGARSRGSDAKKVGAAAGIGAIIGAIAGGGKGAAIGAGVGAGAGGGTVLATRGKDALIPSESRLSFQLRAPVDVTEKR